VTNLYSPANDCGIAWDDPDLGIAWPVAAGQAVLSVKDGKHPRLKDQPHVIA
jgi:dTDP-4-dehydrorhamnose 3,5-epimerase